MSRNEQRKCSKKVFLFFWAHVKYYLFGYSKDHKERCQYKRSYCGWEIPFGGWIAGAGSGLTISSMKEIKDGKPDRLNCLGNIFKHSGVWTSSVKYLQCCIVSLSSGVTAEGPHGHDQHHPALSSCSSPRHTLQQQKLCRLVAKI